jgi:hypothetical protein
MFMKFFNSCHMTLHLCAHMWICNEDISRDFFWHVHSVYREQKMQQNHFNMAYIIFWTHQTSMLQLGEWADTEFYVWLDKIFSQTLRHDNRNSLQLKNALDISERADLRMIYRREDHMMSRQQTEIIWEDCNKWLLKSTKSLMCYSTCWPFCMMTFTWPSCETSQED